MQLKRILMKKIHFLMLPLMLTKVILANEIEGNKILNVMVDHNYELDEENYGSLEDYFTFPFTYNEMEKTLYATNKKEL